MRRILLALGFTLLCWPAFAACPSPITGKDAGGTSQNIGTVVDGSGNCLGKNTIWDYSAGANGAGVDTSHGQLVDPASAALWNTTWAGGTLGAMANYGTSPGAVLVPGANVFITNTAAISIANGSNTVEGSTTDSPCTLPATATACTLTAIAKAAANAINSPPPLGTTGGWTPLLVTALTNAAQAIKSSGGQLGFAQCDNNNAAWTYIQIFNVAFGSVTVGTTVPLQVIPIAPSLSNGFVMNLQGMQFGTAMSAAATTTPKGAAAPATNTINCTFGYN
jgi:hypothetical protein